MLTPQESYPKLAKKIGIPEIILKREDLHPYGSHKGRSIPLMINEYIREGYSDFVISSSGNAALAAAFAVNKYNHTPLPAYRQAGATGYGGVPHSPSAKGKKITLQIFIGKNIEAKKMASLKKIIIDKNINILQVEHPKQSAFQLASKKIKNLRQSTDNLALEGYKSLADELNEIKNLQAVFIPTSSGTTAEALGKFLPRAAQIHIVQTSAHHPIAREFDKKFIAEKKSIAGAIVDMVAHRKEKVMQTIKNSGGSGWIITNDEIGQAINLVKEKTDIKISENSALSVAGLAKAVKNGHVKLPDGSHVASWKFTGAVVCLITGK